MGGFVVMHTGLPHLDTFSELYVYSSGHTSAEALKQFDDNFSPMLKDPKTNDLFRVPYYMAAGETDIALNNGQKVLALFNQYGVRNFWVLELRRARMAQLAPVPVSNGADHVPGLHGTVAGRRSES